MDPYKMAIFPVGIPYLLQKPKHPYCRYFSLQVPSDPTSAKWQRWGYSKTSPDQGSHSVISNKPRLFMKKTHTSTQ